MLSQMKWLRSGLVALMVGVLLSGVALAGKPTKLSDPKNLASSEITDTSITLTWDSGGGEDGFIVGYLEDALPDPKCANVTPVDVGNTPSYLVTDLKPGTTYGFRVCAYSSNKTSDGATLFHTLGGDPSPSPSPPVTYSITWMDTLPGAEYVDLRDLNDFGDVVGFAGDYDSLPHAYLNRVDVNGVREVIDLNDLTCGAYPNWVLIEAMSINNVGQITGAADVNKDGGWVVISYRYTPGSPPILEDLGSGYGSGLRVRDINDQGVVVGDRPSPFRYTDQVEFLEDFVEPDSLWIFKTALRIDDSGRIMGEGEMNGVPHVYRLTPGTGLVEDLGFVNVPSVGPNSVDEVGHIRARDMSGAGHVVGYVVAASRGNHTIRDAFLSTPTGDIMDLGVLPTGTFSDAQSVNDLGQVTGRGSVWPSKKEGYVRSFLYLDGLGIFNLDELIDAKANSGESLTRWDLLTNHYRERINNPRLLDGSLDEQGYGQIIGNGSSNVTGVRENYLLTPVPSGE